mmetsp:Transcript_17112/g.28099  ORF Transcript_17112/g.28099 Transcript_17112/m.28099 type:complete len:211 (-) Transcript_17112:364-996(-)
MGGGGKAPGGSGGGIGIGIDAFKGFLAPKAGGADVANMVLGTFCTPVPDSPVLVDKNSRCGLAAANIRSARLPCLSGIPPGERPPSATMSPSPDVVPFLNAYCTVICRLHRYWLCMHSIAVSLASKESKETKPNPLLWLVMSSLIIFGGRMIVPNAEKVSYSNFSSTSAGSKFPMNKFAPTSKLPEPLFLSKLLLLTLNGLVYNLTMLMI